MQKPRYWLSPVPNYYANRKPSNLNLDANLKKRATAAAKSRYNCRLSELVNRLLQLELSLKKGLLSPMGMTRHVK
jgi:hypothetical protein